MKTITNKLNEVKNNGTTDLLARISLEKNGYINHVGYGKFVLSAKGKRSMGLAG